MTNSPIIDVIIPAYNEEKAIGKVIFDIPKELVRDIIVCNNNSTDETTTEALKAGAKVVHQPQRGYGNACLKGIQYISQHQMHPPPDIIVFMDGDYSDDPRELDAIIEPIRNGKDFVVGSRVLGNALPGSLTIPQVFGNWLATLLIKLLYGHRYTDLGPFRAIRWGKLMEMKMKEPTFGWTVEMQVKALKHRLSYEEVPVSYRKRIGKSKVSGTLRGSILAGQKIIWTIFKSL